MPRSRLNAIAVPVILSGGAAGIHVLSAADGGKMELQPHFRHA